MEIRETHQTVHVVDVELKFDFDRLVTFLILGQMTAVVAAALEEVYHECRFVAARPRLLCRRRLCRRERD